MARLTVEDCLQHIGNRFELILEASKRARQIALGAEPVVEWDNDKPTVVALREIADGHTGLAAKEEQRQVQVQAQAKVAAVDTSASQHDDIDDE